MLLLLLTSRGQASAASTPVIMLQPSSLVELATTSIVKSCRREEGVGEASSALCPFLPKVLLLRVCLFAHLAPHEKAVLHSRSYFGRCLSPRAQRNLRWDYDEKFRRNPPSPIRPTLLPPTSELFVSPGKGWFRRDEARYRTRLCKLAVEDYIRQTEASAQV